MKALDLLPTRISGAAIVSTHVVLSSVSLSVCLSVCVCVCVCVRFYVLKNVRTNMSIYDEV